MKDENFYRRLSEEMVNSQIVSRGVKDRLVIEAIKNVPRHLFVDKENVDEAYSDFPLQIGFSQTISQPYIVALMTELLELKKDDRVLEIGTGSGYQTAVLAEIASEVFTIEKIENLLNKSIKTLQTLGYKNISFKNSNGFKGWIEKSPFNKIIVTAAPQEIPETLEQQLSDGGIMVIPVGEKTWSQKLYKITKINNNLKKDVICDVAFVPMLQD